MAKSYQIAPPMTTDTSHEYMATMKTDKGDVKIELFPKDAPVTVNNFIFLARDGFSDGVIFHRVIPGFVAQGGDPTGSGRGNAGYQFPDEPSGQTHQVGSLSMANAGPNTNGSQFFICYEPQPHLNGRHTAFGRVTEGMDVVRSFLDAGVLRCVSHHRALVHDARWYQELPIALALLDPLPRRQFGITQVYLDFQRDVSPNALPVSASVLKSRTIEAHPAPGTWPAPARAAHYNAAHGRTSALLTGGGICLRAFGPQKTHGSNGLVSFATMSLSDWVVTLNRTVPPRVKNGPLVSEDVPIQPLS